MVNPLGMDLLSWAATIPTDFPDNNIPLIFDEYDWKIWGNELIGCVTFAENNAPDTDGYSDWFPWAQEVYYSMADYV